MKFTIMDVSDAENQMVQHAYTEYGDVFENANGLVSFTWEFLLSINAEAWVFGSFLSQIQKFLFLSLLAAIRNHTVQANMMLRQVIESTALACYALYETNHEKYGTRNDDGTVDINENIKKKIHEWLKSKYTRHSMVLKERKDMINELFSHTNIIATTHNFEFGDADMNMSFFDKPDKLMVKQRLWMIADTTLWLLDLIKKVLEDYPKAKLSDDYNERFNVLGAQNGRIKERLMQNPRFSKWLNNRQETDNE